MRKRPPIQWEHRPVRAFRWLTVTGLCILRLAVFSQGPGVTDSLFNSFSRYSSRHLPEKCFVHTSRNEYLAGDIMWFKLYVFDGLLNKPLALSKVAYVELLDAENNAVVQAKLSLKNGNASGSLDIPDTLAGGWYRLRAYTSWMKNDGPEYFFEKAVRIFNSTGFISPASNNPVDRSGPAGSVPPSTPGYRLQVNRQVSGTIEIVAAIPAGEQPLWLFTQSHGIAKKILTSAGKNGQAIFQLNESDLGEGIQQFTLFNADLQPLSSAAYFIYPRRQMKIDLHCDKAAFLPREAIDLVISSADETNKPLVTDLSLSVYSMDSLSTADTLSMDGYCWVGSELPGTAGSYAAAHFREPLALTAMDSLIQRHQWKRFAWNDIFAGQGPVYVPETRDHIISGKVVSTAGGKSAPLIYAYASLVGKETLFRAAESDSTGNIRFEMPGFNGTNSLIVQTAGEDSAYRVELFSPFSDRYPKAPANEGKPDSNAAPGIAGRLFNAQIENVYQADSQQKWQPVPAGKSFFYGKPDYRYHLDDYKRFTTMEEVMREYIKTVNVFRSEGLVKLVMMNDPAKQFLTGSPLVLVDGVPDFDPGRPMNIDPLKIRDIELVNREYLLGPQKYAGIINCISYNGDLAGLPLPTQASTVNYEGLQPERLFYSPSYATVESRYSRIPDYRSQLYWAPSLFTGTDGKKQVRFYASDLPGRYAVVVNGLTADGIAGSKTIYITIGDGK